jgi:hypothetical protein
MCISNILHSDHQIALLGFFGGGVVLALIATSMIMSDLLNSFTEAPVRDTAVTTVQKGAENARVGSNQAHIEQLLEKHGGQLHQRHIVTETGWSKAKVSLLLSDMEADEQLTKIRLGRENLVVLPGHEPGFMAEPSSIDEKNS